MAAKKNSASPVVVLITASSVKEAQRIADKLLGERKAACVNIVTGISSFFWWQGNIDSAMETLLVVKSREDLLPDMINLVKANHSYEMPEIIALPIAAGNPEYLEWIKRETRQH